MTDTRDQLRGLNYHLDALQRIVPSVEGSLSSRTLQSGAMSPEELSELRSSVVKLNRHLGALQTAVPRLENAIHSRAGIFGLAARETADLPVYVRSVADQLARLRYAVPRLERALSARAWALKGLEPMPTVDLRMHLVELRRRIATLKRTIPPLERALTPKPEAIPVTPATQPSPVPFRLAALLGAPLASAWLLLAGVRWLPGVAPALYSRATGWLATRKPVRELEPPTLRELIDRRRVPGEPVIEDVYERPRWLWHESMFSRRRLRYLILPAALLVMIVGFGTATYWNGDFQQQSVAKATVRNMSNAVSYRATGVDISRTEGLVQEVREQFTYVAPHQVRTNYKTTARRTTDGTEVPMQCADKDIVIVAATRYQKCSDEGTAIAGWRVDSFDPDIFDTSLFQPFMRYSWCRDIQEAEELQTIEGVSTGVFTCTVVNQREAAVVWQRDGDDLPDTEEIERFIREAKVEITVWVRQTDGYIGRFAMTKTFPSDNGPITQTVDYVYSDFDEVCSVELPEVSEEPAEGEGGQTGSLPRFAVVNGQTFHLEIAADKVSLARGLANRPILPEDTAMLFVFPSEQVLTFWMKDVMMPLDVLFLDARGRIIDIHTMLPQPGAPESELVRYTSAAPAQYGLEINAGQAEKYGFEVGMTVELRVGG